MRRLDAGRRMVTSRRWQANSVSRNRKVGGIAGDKNADRHEMIHQHQAFEAGLKTRL